ncbi:hypothetical protein VNO77_29824 [Canavalia gladiata]|uniref:Uncharacterized protein n=1 Tax=Canavalia gladiata TaxID=3824 RepID=A0AAN9KQY8_CANGL
MKLSAFPLISFTTWAWLQTHTLCTTSCNVNRTLEWYRIIFSVGASLYATVSKNKGYEADEECESSAEKLLDEDASSTASDFQRLNITDSEPKEEQSSQDNPAENASTCTGCSELEENAAPASASPPQNLDAARNNSDEVNVQPGEQNRDLLSSPEQEQQEEHTTPPVTDPTCTGCSELEENAAPVSASPPQNLNASTCTGCSELEENAAPASASPPYNLDAARNNSDEVNVQPGEQNRDLLSSPEQEQQEEHTTSPVTDPTCTGCSELEENAAPVSASPPQNMDAACNNSDEVNVQPGEQNRDLLSSPEQEQQEEHTTSPVTDPTCTGCSELEENAAPASASPPQNLDAARNNSDEVNVQPGEQNRDLLSSPEQEQQEEHTTPPVTDPTCTGCSELEENAAPASASPPQNLDAARNNSDEVNVQPGEQNRDLLSSPEQEQQEEHTTSPVTDPTCTGCSELEENAAPASASPPQNLDAARNNSDEVNVQPGEQNRDLLSSPEQEQQEEHTTPPVTDPTCTGCSELEENAAPVSASPPQNLNASTCTGCSELEENAAPASASPPQNLDAARNNSDEVNVQPGEQNRDLLSSPEQEQQEEHTTSPVTDPTCTGCSELEENAAPASASPPQNLDAARNNSDEVNAQSGEQNRDLLSSPEQEQQEEHTTPPVTGPSLRRQALMRARSRAIYGYATSRQVMVQVDRRTRRYRLVQVDRTIRRYPLGRNRNAVPPRSRMPSGRADVASSSSSLIPTGGRRSRFWLMPGDSRRLISWTWNAADSQLQTRNQAGEPVTDVFLILTRIGDQAEILNLYFFYQVGNDISIHHLYFTIFHR